jgi:hypothetical protein
MAIRTIAIIQGHYIALQGHSHADANAVANGLDWFYDLAGFEVLAGYGRDIEGLGSRARSHSRASYNSALHIDVENSAGVPTSLFGRSRTTGERTLLGDDVDHSSTTRPPGFPDFDAEENYQYHYQDQDQELESSSTSLDTSLSSADYEPPSRQYHDYDARACGIGLGISGLLSKDGTAPFTGLGVISVRPFAWRHAPPATGGGTATSASFATGDKAPDINIGNGGGMEPERLCKMYYYGRVHAQCHTDSEIDLETRLHCPNANGLGHNTATESPHTRTQAQALDAISEYYCDPESATSSSPSLYLPSNAGGIVQRPRLTDTGMEMEATPTQPPMLTPITNADTSPASSSSRRLGNDYARYLTSLPSARPMKGFAAPTISSGLKRRVSATASTSNLAILNANRGQRHYHRSSGSGRLDVMTMSSRFIDSSDFGDSDRENKANPLHSEPFSARTPTNVKTTSIRHRGSSLAGVVDVSTNPVSMSGTPRAVPRWR